MNDYTTQLETQVDGPLFEERVQIIRCVQCDLYSTVSSPMSNRGKLQCPRCGTPIRPEQIRTYVDESVVPDE